MSLAADSKLRVAELAEKVDSSMASVVLNIPRKLSQQLKQAAIAGRTTRGALVTAALTGSKPRAAAKNATSIGVAPAGTRKETANAHR